MFDLLDNLVPMLIFFMLLRGILDVLLGKGKRKQRQQEENPPGYEGEQGPDYGSRPDYEATQERETEDINTKKEPDLAADFERRLRKSQKNQQEQNRERQRVYTDKEQSIQQEKVLQKRQDKQRVHYDGEVHHEGKGRIHRDAERLQHDKSRLYRDPRGDYSYNEEAFNKETTAFAARYAQEQNSPQRKLLKLKHAALVNGFIMAQVLDKPRSLKPYGTEEI